MKSEGNEKAGPSGPACYASRFAGPPPPGAGGRPQHIVLITASGILDAQSLVSSGKSEREFGKLEL